MSLSRWSRALLATLVLAGCKANTSAELPAPPPLPLSGPALSYLKSTGPQGCDWVRQPLPSGPPSVVFSFNEACPRAMVSWSPEGKEGVVFIPSSGEPAVPKAWRVELATHAGKPVDLKTLPGSTGASKPDQPWIEELGFDKQGQLVALLADMYVKRHPEKGEGSQEFVTFEGQRYLLNKGEEGGAGLAHAYRLEEGGWKHFETKASHFESDLAPGIRKLDAEKTLMPVVPEPSLGPHMPGNEAPESDAKKLDTAFPGKDDGGHWMALPTPGGTVYFWAAGGEEFLYPALPVAWEQGDTLVEVKGLSAKPAEGLDLQVQDGLLLISHVNEPLFAQVWDTRTKERVFSVEQAHAPTFWPKPGGP